MSFTIIPATVAHYPKIVDILVDAFAADPAFLRMIPQPDPDNEKLRALFTLELKKQYAVAGHVDLALNDEGEALGVALWDFYEGRPQAAESLAALPDLWNIFGRGTAQVIKTEMHSSTFHPNFPHWYLYTLATPESARGQGIGTALLNYGFDRAGNSGIYLEATSTRAAQLYQRLGFVSMGYIPTRDGSHPELAMWKPPALPQEN
ncbi:GNAT family N-acetyltransferase [Corynebacterium callunae]|uniref:GNAT family N-acetyltransferase n=1 Tax=Corynebacterium callunae TaxID=1721 RepID=UPI0039826177